MYDDDQYDNQEEEQEEDQSEDRQRKISFANRIGLVGVSIFFDIVELLFDLIPVVGWIINVFVDIFAFLTFYVWFKILDVSFVGTRRSMAFISGFILGLIPFTSWFAWTLDVVLVIIDVNNEDKLARFKKPMARRGTAPKEQRQRGARLRAMRAARTVGGEISPK